MDFIEYDQLPPSAGGYSSLFYDFLKNFSAVSKYFTHDFRDPASYKTVIDSLSTRHTDRSVLVEVLKAQNRAFQSSAKTFENIELLLKKTTFAVVTGQQVGIFGGPLYTIYKTITAIKLAEELKKKHPSYDFVPIFWIEGEDHDFAEMNNIGGLRADGMFAKVEYLPGGEMPTKNMGAVGELVFDQTLEQTLASLESMLQKTEFTEPVLTMLKRAYAPGRTFNGAFAAWMNLLFHERGLVFVSPNDPTLKRMMSSLFEREISNFPKTSQLVIERSAELEESYYAQIKAKSVNLFLFHKNGRYLIEPREHDFSLKGTRHFISPEELNTIAREAPEQLSPNVVLRPIAQDTILPTVAYVAGPSEVAYNAQLGPVYDFFDVVRPVVYPRASASFASERLERLIEKYQLQPRDFFEKPEVLTSRIVAQISEVNLDQLFVEAKKRMDDGYKELAFGLREVDPTLIGALEGVQSKGDHNLQVLKEKSAAAQKRRNETVVRQIEKASQEIMPGGSLQERNLSIIYFMNKYGPDLVQWFFSELDVNAFRHQVLTL